jgi:hypothetical protein
MTNEEFDKLKRGDIVRNIGSKGVYVVTDNFGDRKTAVMTADLTNPQEWEIVNINNEPPEE